MPPISFFLFKTLSLLVSSFHAARKKTLMNSYTAKWACILSFLFNCVLSNFKFFIFRLYVFSSLLLSIHLALSSISLNWSLWAISLYYLNGFIKIGCFIPKCIGAASILSQGIAWSTSLSPSLDKRIYPAWYHYSPLLIGLNHHPI
jgi:hypothetical protein